MVSLVTAVTGRSALSADLLASQGEEHMQRVLDLTDESFDTALGDGITIVEFWSPDCRPCKIVTPALAELADEYAGRATFARVNTAEEVQVALRNRVLGVPTVIYYVDGQPRDVLYTSYPKQVYRERLDQLFENSARP